MNCLHCHAPNEDGAKFCKDCGKNLSIPPLTENLNSKFSDNMLLVFLVVTFALSVFQFAIEKLVDNLYESKLMYIQRSLFIIKNVCFILIPLSIRNQTIKIIGIVVTVILIVYWVSNHIFWMLKSV